MKKSVNHIAVNAMQVTGEYSHVPYPAKIEVKQAVTAAPSRSTQSRHAPRVIMQETHNTITRSICRNTFILSYTENDSEKKKP